MKKKGKVIFIIVLIVIVVLVISIIFMLSKNKIVSHDDYYSVTYSASYNTYHVLDNSENYEIVKDETKLKDILNKISSNDNVNKFNSDFFEGKNLLVIEGGIDSEVNKLNINNTKAEVEIYCATPLTTADQSWKYDMYFIPIEKNIEDINVKVSAYPDRLY